MTEVDYALATPSGTRRTPPRRPTGWCSGSTGLRAFGMAWDTNPSRQIVAVVVRPDHQDRGQNATWSRPGIAFLDTERALDVERGWPFLSDSVVDLAAVKAHRRRRTQI